MDTKWKLTFRYVLSIVAVAILVVIFNIVILLFGLIYNRVHSSQEYSPNGESENFVRSFSEYIKINTEKDLYLDDEGKIELDNKGLWIQILNEDSKEVYNYRKPKVVKEKYTPAELINSYKYLDELNGYSQILVSEKTIGEKNYTYIIGFSGRTLEKVIFIAETDFLAEYLRNVTTIILIVDIVIAILFGYIFSRGLTKPIKKIIGGVDELSIGNYSVYYKERGIYGKVFGKLNILSDKLESSKTEREKVEKMREDWIANISHDIKTPLSSIKGYAEILGEDYDFSVEDVKDYACIINEKTNYIKELVDDLNLTMKLKNNKSIVKKREVNIVSLVKSFVIDIFNDPKYSERQIEFNQSEEVIIKNVDEILIKRAINNIIYNALVHNDENVRISVNIFNNEKTHILISDTGKGIKEEELKYIFDKYYRGTNTGEVHKGSGLGMAIAKEIIKAHGGEIKIRSELGRGTEIEMIIP